MRSRRRGAFLRSQYQFLLTTIKNDTKSIKLVAYLAKATVGTMIEGAADIWWLR